MKKLPSTVLVKWSERRRALVALSSQSRAWAEHGRAWAEQGRALAKRVPEPVQLELKRISSHGAGLTREIFAGLLVVGLVTIVAGYSRLANGPVSLPSLVPAIEASINGELTNLHVKIDDAVLQRSRTGPGIAFRLKNIRLLDNEDSVIAQAPYAAIGLSGAALLSGRIAPGNVDFIGPRLLLFYNDEQGLALSFSETEASDLARIPGADAPPRTGGGDQSQASPFGELKPSTEYLQQHAAELKADSGRQLNVAETISEVFEQARRGTNSYLTRFGVQDAMVVLSQNGKQTFWQVPSFSVDLEHHETRSVLLGQAVLSSPKGDWKFDFKTAQKSKHRLAVTATIEDLVPSGLAASIPEAKGLEAFDIPISGETQIELSRTGEVLKWKAGLDLKSGEITVPWEKYHPMWLDSGELHLSYSKGKKEIDIDPSTLKWGNSRLTFSGRAAAAPAKQGEPERWAFDLKADQADFGAVDFGVPPVRLDELAVQGSAYPGEGRLVMSRFVARVGDASLVLSGNMTEAPGSPAMQLQGRMSAMPILRLKQLWPKFVAAGAREWVGKNVEAGEVQGGTVSIDIKPGELKRVLEEGAQFSGTVAMDLKATDLAIGYVEGLPPVMAPEADLALRGTTFYADVPTGTITLPSGDRIDLHTGRYQVQDLRPPEKTAVLSFEGEAGTSAVLQLLDQKPLQYISKMGKDPASFGGTANGKFVFTIPLRDGEDLKFQDIAINGTADVHDVVARNVMDDLNIEGGNYKVNLTDQAVEVRGDVMVKGVPADVVWQRLFYLPDDKQPPIRLQAVLDAADRAKLGLNVNDMVKGLLPVNFTVGAAPGGKMSKHLQADLTNTELVLANMGWVKPAGRRAVLEVDLEDGDDGSTILNNFKMRGDNDINIDGRVVLDDKKRVRNLHFSDFSFNVITHVEITGERGADGVLRVRMQGPSFDGKQFFRSLFSAGQLSENQPESGDDMDMDVAVHFGTVVGWYDTTLQNFDATMKKRKGDLVALDARGLLNGDAAVAVRLENSGGKRLLRAESRDAGDAFRLVGFYRQVQGGEGTLLVDLDAGRGGMKRGTLWARNFELVSDKVVSDVLSDKQSDAAFGKQRRPARDRIVFNQLRAPFSVGHQSFQLDDAYMNGPLLGATMRGDVNFKAHTVDLGGTYVPLYGLNSALGQIPILGNLLVGRQGEGIVGITFAIKGDLNDPAVLVNPMSVVAPGIFRQIFEFNGTPPDNSRGSSTRH